MNGAYALSISNIQRLLNNQWQLSFSTGAVSQATCSVTDWLQPLYQQIGNVVRELPIAHADETSHYRNNERRWLWVLCSSQVVYFLTHHSRGKGAANRKTPAVLGAYYPQVQENLRASGTCGCAGKTTLASITLNCSLP